jgi:predicted tellurium resistance membrane protein TerC
MTGHIGSIQVTQVFLLSAALIIEIPIMMIVLARVLRYRVNRWVNIIAGVLMVVIQVGSMGFGTPPSLVYVCYSTLEVVVNLLIVWLAWKWSNPESQPK